MTPTSITQEDVVAKIYRDFARLAGEIAIDRCRTRVLLSLVKDKLGMGDEQLNELFRAELESNLEQFCHDITQPMLVEDAPTSLEGCCGGGSGAGA